MLGQSLKSLFPQGEGAATRRPRLMAAAVFGAAFTAVGPAAADSYSFDVVALNNPLITVASNIDEYTTLQNGSSIAGTIRVELDAGLSGRVKFWSTRPVMGYQSNENPGWADSWGNFHTAGTSQSYSVPRPKTVDEQVPFSLLPEDYESTMVAACENHADKLRGQGMSNTEIFDQDRWIQVAVSAWGDHEMTGIEGNPYLPEVTGWNQYKKVNVICKGDPVDLGPIATDITAATLSANDDQSVHGSCELQLSGSITSSEPNTQVKFLYVDDEGQQSNLNTVTTNAEGVAVFEHDYPVNANKSGKVRMIGQSPPFFSNWADYDVNCGGPSNEKVSALPPKAAVLTLAVDEEVSHQGKICPAVIQVIGRIDGRGKASGTMNLGAGGNQIAEKPFSIEDDESKLIAGKYQISWQNKPATQQNVPLTLIVRNAVGDTVDALQKMKSVECRSPEVNSALGDGADQFAPGIPTPKSVSLSVSPLGKKTQNGYVCPESAYMSGSVNADANGFTGTAGFFAGGSLKHEMPVDLDPNHGHGTSYMHELDWSSGSPTQTVAYALKVRNEYGTEVGSKEVIEHFVCQKIITTDVVNNAAGGYSTGKPKPPLSQQAGKPAAVGKATLLPGATFAIQSPKGLVRQGQIQLSGGKPTAKYALRFYRKTENGYQRVRSAKLPRQMTGSKASFKLKALSGSRSWRLEVCPFGSKDKKACKASDFQLPRLKAASKVKAPANPATTKVFIMPGIGN